MINARPPIAIVGGTGKQGLALGVRWAKAGHKVILGSRYADKALQVANELNVRLGCQIISGANDLWAAESAEIVVLTVPFTAQRTTVEEVRSVLDGKILIDVTVPLVPPKISRVQLPPGGSAVENLQRDLGSKVKVVSAFQNVSAHHLRNLEAEVKCDVLVCSDYPEAAEVGITLAKAAGLRGFYAGPLANSVATEALTSVLITINRHYKVSAAGIRITGVPD